MTTNDSVKKYISSFQASEYKVQLAHANKEQYKPILVHYSPEKLMRSIAFLKHKNTLGYNIYCRPIGYEYVLLDDLKREVLQDLATIKPCLLMETSPANYQAFITLTQVPDTREKAIEVCKQLAQKFNADKGSAEPDHVGRLPGFTNRKAIHRNAGGVYPFVKLHKAEKRISTFIPRWGGCVQIKHPHSVIKSTYDRSRQDFNLVCMLIKQGKCDDFIIDTLSNQSEKAKERGEKYIDLTIKNARKALNIYV